GSAERICASLKTIGKLEESFNRLKQRNADPKILNLVAAHLEEMPRVKKAPPLVAPSAPRLRRPATVDV
ncbi:MAG: hypothetical protein ACREQW_14935, partial [Candidatus Binatia bacterium]